MYVTAQDLAAGLPEPVALYLVDDDARGALRMLSGDFWPEIAQRLDRACDDANAEVDSYLLQRYELPLSSIPPVLAARALDVARYRLFLRRGIREQTADEAIERAYKVAIAWLRDVAAGRAALPLPINQPAATNSSLGPRITSRQEIMRELEDL